MPKQNKLVDKLYNYIYKCDLILTILLKDTKSLNNMVSDPLGIWSYL